MKSLDLFKLDGRVAIVTGGNGGIGLGIAEGLAGAGANVVIAARNAAKNDKALARVGALGPQALAVTADVAKEADWKTLVARVLETFGRIDILVNNAGVLLGKPPQDYSMDEWRSILDINLTGAFMGARAVHPEMLRQKGGKIINICSLTAFLGSPLNVPYTASKGGMLQLTRGLATAWAKDNIQVNAISPGWTDTDLAAAGRARVPDFDRRILARTPAGRLGQPEDFAGIAVFLASAASSFITGAEIVVDGGYSVQL